MNQHTEELEKNELVEWSKNKFGHLLPHARLFLLGVVGIIALIFGLAYYVHLQSQLQADKWRQLHSAIYSMNEMQNASGLQLVHEESPDTPTSHAAMLIAGDAYLKLGLQKMISDRVVAEKDLKKAKESLLTVVESKKKPSELIETRALFALAYACESLGEFDEAKKYYTSLNENFKDSAFAKQARRGLERLADGQIRKIYEQFKSVGVAPGTALPKRPDIEFPDLDAPTEPLPKSESVEPAPTKDMPKTEEKSTGAEPADKKQGD